MTEDEAKAWIVDEFGQKKFKKLERFVGLVAEEAGRQNLISAATLETIWTRHVVDSAQLIKLAGQPGDWIDIGTGAGFPGVVVGILSEYRTTLVEPRRRRVEFLQRVIEVLELERTTIEHSRIEVVRKQAAIISARAVASLDAILTSSIHCANPKTWWLLPKGLNSAEEMARAKASWHGTFHVEHSITDPKSMIVIASGVSRR